MKKILIVDDDVIIRITFNKLLKSGNYIIKQAKEVGEAIRVMKSEIFDVILLDLKLPPNGWEGGYTILKKKRKIALNESTPVIIISASPDDEGIKKKLTLEDNVAHIFIKPVENKDLLDKITEVLGQ